MNDSSLDQDATIYIPTGGRGVPRFASAAQNGAMLDFDSLTGINPLVAAATPIFCSIIPLRFMLTHPDPGGLRESQLLQIANFEKFAKNAAIAPEVIMIARYALCTFVDETVAATPWGGADCLRNSLLLSLHKEAGGGEKFFQVLNKIAEDPARNLVLLEFFYVCLSLGFEGRFRIISGGKAQLDSAREQLALLIKRQKGEYERDLSKQWRGEMTSVAKMDNLLPFWVTLAAVTLLLAVIFIFYLFRLNAHADQVIFSSVNPPKPVIKAVLQPVKVSPRLAVLLADEITKGMVQVRDEPLESVVTIPGDGLFDSGKADLKPVYEAIIYRITDSLNQVPGQIMVIGHTDNIPSRSVQFPSNWHLSKARAASVERLIKSRLAGQRTIVSEGRAETEAIAANDTPANRALNRRVEIFLKVAL